MDAGDPGDNQCQPTRFTNAGKVSKSPTASLRVGNLLSLLILIHAATSYISNLSPRLNLASPNKTQPASIPPLAPGVIFDQAMAMAMA
jgi:hypothetical protein